MNASEITDEQFIEAVRAIVAERGEDFEYEPEHVGSDEEGDITKCLYSANGGSTGHCLFGAALIEQIGLSYDTDWEGRTIGPLVQDLGIPLSSHVRVAAMEAQNLQDSGSRYSLVLAEFENIIAHPEV